MKFFGTWLLFALGFVASATSFAAPATSVVSAEDRSFLASRWSGMLQTQYNQSLYNQEDGTQSATEDFTAELGYKINRNYTLKFHIDGTQDLRHQEDSDMGKAVISLGREPFKVADKMFLVSPGASIRLPVSRDDQRASFQTAVSAKLKTAINPDFMISKKWDVAMTLAGTRYVHQYEEATDGSINTEYKFVQVFSTGWAFTEWLAIALEFDHINAWDYQGVQKETYAHTEELDFTLTKNWALAIGHQYGNPMASVWAPNQQDYNFNLMDEQNSLVFGQVTFTF